MLNTKVLCWADGDRCPGCDHYYGKAEECVYKPKPGLWMRVNDFGRWLVRVSQKRLS